MQIYAYLMRLLNSHWSMVSGQLLMESVCSGETEGGISLWAPSDFFIFYFINLAAIQPDCSSPQRTHIAQRPNNISCHQFRRWVPWQPGLFHNYGEAVNYILITHSTLQTSKEVCANSVGPDGPAHHEPSHQELHCLPVFFKWPKIYPFLARLFEE